MTSSTDLVWRKIALVLGVASLLGGCSGSCGPVYDSTGPWPRAAGADAGDGDGGELDAGHGTLAAQGTDAPVSIDGQLNEAAWSMDTRPQRLIEGASDNDARFDALWDSRYLYIGFRVLDAQLTADSNAAHQDDSVEVYLDPNLSRSTAYDAYDRQFIVGINRPELFEAHGNIAGILHASTLIPGGYSVELAIPWAKLGMTPASGATLGFDVQNNDDDDGGARDGALGWHTADLRNWTDTSGFGELRLSGASAVDDATDVDPPSISIDAPTSFSIYGTSAQTLALSGQASDNVEVSQVTCAVDTGAACVVHGTSRWEIESLSLALGENVVTVTARDRQGNASADTLAVTRQMQADPGGPVLHPLPVYIDAVATQPYRQIGTSRIVSTPAGQYREAEATTHSLFAYAFKASGSPGGLVKMTLLYPDDKPRVTTILGGDNGTDSIVADKRLGSGYITDIQHRGSGGMVEQTYYFWLEATSASEFGVNFLTWSGAGAAVKAMKVEKVDLTKASMAWPAEATRPDRRSIGLYWEDPALNDNFGYVNSRSSAAFAAALEKQVVYMKRIGATSVMYPEAWYLGTCYQPSSEASPPTGGLGCVGRAPDNYDQILARRYSQEGFAFWPTIWTWSLPSLAAYRKSATEIQSGLAIEYVNNVTMDGEVRIGRGHWSRPNVDNVLHPRVQTALKGLVKEIAERLRDESSFRGIVLWSVVSSTFGLSDLTQSYDDYTVKQFASENSLVLPNASGPSRFGQWYNWLKTSHWNAWVAWRKRKLTALYGELADIIASRKAGAKLQLMMANPAPVWDPVFVRATSEHLDAIGVDLAALSGNANILISRHYTQHRFEWYLRVWGPSSPPALEMAARQGLDFDANWQRPFLGRVRGAVMHYNYYEHDVSGLPRGYREWPWHVEAPKQAGRLSLEYLARSIAMFDVAFINHGGYNLGPQGMEDLLQPFSATFSSLPTVAFETIGEKNGVILRGTTTEQAQWYYIINGSDQTQRVSFAFPYSGKLYRLGLTPGRMEVSPTQNVEITIPAYDIMAWKNSPPS